MHREVDIEINRMEKEIGEIKVKHPSILQKYLDEIKQFQSPTLQTLNKMKESNEVSATINYSCKKEELSKLPSKVILSMPTFIPKTKK